VLREEYQDVEVIKRDDLPYAVTEFRSLPGLVHKKEAFTPETGEWESYLVEKLFKSEKRHSGDSQIIPSQI